MLSMVQSVWIARLTLSEIISGQNVNKIGSYLGQRGPRLSETPLPKEATFLGCSIKQEKDLKVYNLTTANATLLIHQNYVPPTP